MRKYAGLEKLRKGHPCWRKLTDPMLLAQDGDEVVVVDPDVYFPRRFDFESVGDGTLRLMWQKPNCMLPFSVVQLAFDKGIAMADHVDIGIAQYQSPLDLDWLDWVVNSLGDLPPGMHVESILWSCLAMRMGGGYLNPQRWHCRAYTHWKRVLKIAGVTPGACSKPRIFAHVWLFMRGERPRHGWPMRARGSCLNSWRTLQVGNRFGRRLCGRLCRSRWKSFGGCEGVKRSFDRSDTTK